MTESVIPKVLHFVWIGDETKRPDNCIETWRELNPAFEIMVWGNREFEEEPWRTKKHMREMLDTGQIYGAVDLMRWEILYNEGGFVLDADSICINPLPDWLFECDAFACWENEIECPGLIANGYFAAAPGDAFVGAMIDRLAQSKRIATQFSWRSLKRKRRSAWKVTGPLFLTDMYRELKYTKLTILPSHFFIPRYTSGLQYRGKGLVICDQLFGSTKSTAISYDNLHEFSAAELREQVSLNLR